MIGLRVAAALVSIPVSVAAEAQQAVQWPISAGGNGHWYRRSSVRLDWTAANAAAAAEGAHLATLTSPQENAFVLASGAARHWLQSIPIIAPDICQADRYLQS